MASPAAKHFAKVTGKELPEEEKETTTSSADTVPDNDAKAEAPKRHDSPAKRHFVKESTKAEAEKSAESGTAYGNATQYELMLAQLAGHKHQLKEIQSIERKVELKRKLLPEYLPYVEGVLEGKAGVQDDVLMTIMVWAVDTGDLELALRIGSYALANGLETPDQYSRDTATLLTELYADEALGGHEIDADTLLAVCDLTSQHDMPDEVRAKLHRAIGLSLEAVSLESALEHLERAVELHERVGAKKEIERIERAIKNREKNTP